MKGFIYISRLGLSNEGIIGVVRAGFELKRRALFYKINDYEIICGKLKPKNNII